MRRSRRSIAALAPVARKETAASAKSLRPARRFAEPVFLPPEIPARPCRDSTRREIRFCCPGSPPAHLCRRASPSPAAVATPCRNPTNRDAPAEIPKPSRRFSRAARQSNPPTCYRRDANRRNNPGSRYRWGQKPNRVPRRPPFRSKRSPPRCAKSWSRAVVRCRSASACQTISNRRLAARAPISKSVSHFARCMPAPRRRACPLANYRRSPNLPRRCRRSPPARRSCDIGRAGSARHPANSPGRDFQSPRRVCRSRRPARSAAHRASPQKSCGGTARP